MPEPRWARLHGIPVAVKDLCEVAGWPLRCGSAAWTGRHSTVTATIVDRLVGAGAILVGKTHMVEFAFGAWGTNRHLGTPLNPWDLAVPRVPGGSSSGSGVAVSAGLVPAAAIGSDTGGSIRVPAAMCGIVGAQADRGPYQPGGHGRAQPHARLDRSADPVGRGCGPAPVGPSRSRPGRPRDTYVASGDPGAGLRAGVRGLRLGALPQERWL